MPTIDELRAEIATVERALKDPAWTLTQRARLQRIKRNLELRIRLREQTPTLNIPRNAPPSGTS